MLPVLLPVVKRRRETGDTVTLALDPGPEGFGFAPGQFNMLTVLGLGEVPISISGDPGDRSRLVHTIRAVGPVTRALCRLTPGATVGVRGPYGTPWPVAGQTGRDILIIAGGLGLAPLRPALCQVLARRREFGAVEVIYGARRPEDLLYREELSRWRGRFDVRVHVTVDAAGADWRGPVGVVTTLIPHARFDPPYTSAFICGPGVMMRFTVGDLLARGVPEERIFVSLERNMQCGLGLCGHCQLGPLFVCKDGPVFSYARVKEWLTLREI
ncbi:MAG: FAD/NAD(P)-binding protein [Syntrophobacterales bacterium]|nr:FAD/NAD(P)-binding protein [Syntrophobacterales bacterium]